MMMMIQAKRIIYNQDLRMNVLRNTASLNA